MPEHELQPADADLVAILQRGSVRDLLTHELDLEGPAREGHQHEPAQAPRDDGHHAGHAEALAHEAQRELDALGTALLLQGLRQVVPVGLAVARHEDAGVRGRLAESTTYEAAIYNIDVKDELIPFETATRGYYVNAGKSDRTGLELSLQSEPLDNLRFVLSYTYSDFEFDEFVDNDGNVFSGNTLPGIPEHFLFGEVSYTHPSGFFGILDMRFVDDLYANNGNTVSVDSYTISNVRFGLERPMGGFIASPFIGINNLFDESYNSDIRINAFGGRYYEPAPDRNLYAGIELRYDF